MPTVINGVGTWDYGKRNLHTHRDVCEYCGREGDLQCFDTTRYFVVLFVPIIPLGKKRVLNRCPACSRFSETKLKVWEQLRKEKLSAALGAFRDDRQDPDKAMTAIGTTIAFQDADSFEKLTKYVLDAFPADPEISIMLGEAYEYFGQYEKTEERYRHALALKDDPAAREKLAVFLMRRLRPVEAQPLLGHLLVPAQASADPAGATEDEASAGRSQALLTLLVESLQAVGDHRAALDVLKQAESIYPEWASEKAFTKARKLSEKHAATRKPIKSARLAKPKKPAGATSGGGSSWVPRVLVPLLIVLVVGGYLYAAWSQGQERSVFVVNGTKRKYRVRVGPQTVNLRARSWLELRLPEGKLDTQVLDADLPSDLQTCVIRTPFWKRPFIKRTFVVNPDRTAVLVWEETTYRTNPATARDDDYGYSLDTGRLLHMFRGIDYEFESFPDEISMEGSKTKRQRVSLLTEWYLPSLLEYLQQQLGQEDCVRFLKRSLGFQPEEELFLYGLNAFVPKEEMLALLKPRLGERPVLVEWHRFYQSCMLAVRPDHDVAAEYRALLAEEPNEQALKYLLGRVELDPAVSERLFQSAVGDGKTGARALGALAFKRLTNARFEDALAFVSKGQEVEPDLPVLSQVEELALEALGRYDALFERVEKAQADDEEDATIMYPGALWLLRKGDVEAADKFFERFMARIRKEAGDDAAAEWSAIYRANRAYITGNLTEFADLASKLEGGTWKLEAAVCAGRPADAAQLLTDENDAYDHLTLHVAALNGGEKELAKQELAKAIDGLRGNATVEERYAADVLAGRTHGNAELLAGFAVLPERKRVLLTAIGLRDPQCRDACFAMARELNFNRHFPYWLIKRVLDNGTAGAPQ